MDAAKSELRVRAFKMPTEREGKLIFWNNPEISAFFYALSVTLPVTEDLMISSCRDFVNDLEDEKLKSQVRWYIGQEAHHSKAHHELNKWIEDLGVNVDLIISKFKAKLDSVYKMDKYERLAFSVGLENLTTIICRHLLKNVKTYEEVPSFCRDLMIWHAFEEMEHKAVLYDLYEAVGMDQKIKKRTYIQGTKLTMLSNLEFSEMLLNDLGIKPTFKEKLKAARYFYGFKGIMTYTLFNFFSYMRKRFHPNNHDDSKLIEKWEERNKHIEFDLRTKTII